MTWKLHTSDGRMQQTMQGFEQYDSRVSALETACDRMRETHVKILYIEGPNGERIEAAAVVAWCKARFIGED
jgi:hypothetical protein